MEREDEGVDEPFVEFLRREAVEEARVPPELQKKIERRIEATLEVRGKMGWGSTAVISAAASLVLGLANPGSFDPAFVLLLGVAAVVYGAGVRQLTATPGSAVQESSA